MMRASVIDEAYLSSRLFIRKFENPDILDGNPPLENGFSRLHFNLKSSNNTKWRLGWLFAETF